ncbi:hypothetical protein HYW76_02750 [Candidatus Pacearchaeota archaeon]|nr:hypothetical protein [Candidatus Pacearchaeota archaeon]
MLFMIVWWVLIIGFFLLLIIKRLSQTKKVRYILSRILDFLVIIQFVIVITAVATKDPIFQEIGLPPGYEWMAGLFGGGFLLWISYLNPLKKRITETEINVEGISKRVVEIKDDISWIKNNCKISFNK